MGQENLLTRRRDVLEGLIKEVQTAISELANEVAKDGVNKIFSSNLTAILQRLTFLHHKLAVLEVELTTLNSFENYE